MPAKIGRKSPNVQSFGIKIELIDRDLLWVYVTDRFGGYIYKEAQSEPKETSISGSRLYYGNHYIMLPINTRVVEGGQKTPIQGLLARSVESGSFCAPIRRGRVRELGGAHHYRLR